MTETATARPSYIEMRESDDDPNFGINPKGLPTRDDWRHLHTLLLDVTEFAVDGMRHNVFAEIHDRGHADSKNHEPRITTEEIGVLIVGAGGCAELLRDMAERVERIVSPEMQQNLRDLEIGCDLVGGAKFTRHGTPIMDGEES